jgi:enoyl-CoA hydratase
MNSTVKPTQTDLGTAPSLHMDGPIATIQFNRPSVHNRFQGQDLVIIRSLIDEVNANLAIRVLVFTGTGATFSSGFDLGEFQGKALAPEMNFEPLTDAVEMARPITIARVQGPVYGGATDLILACDFKIAVDHTAMFMPAAKIGLHYYANGLQRWVARLGLSSAKRLFLTAEKIDAAEMLRIGFVDMLVSISGLDAAVASRTQQLLQLPPQALEDLKRSLNECARGEFNYTALHERHQKSIVSNDMKEALAARAQKRQPQFTRS